MAKSRSVSPIISSSNITAAAIVPSASTTSYGTTADGNDAISFSALGITPELVLGFDQFDYEVQLSFNSEPDTLFIFAV